MSARTRQPSAWRGAAYGLAAAALFGASAPVAKVLLGSVAPTVLAGLLYLGAAAGLWLVRAAHRPADETPLRRQDAPVLALIVLLGGIGGPILMLHGLQHLPGVTGSLLLNLEARGTMVVAVLLFREHLGRHALLAIGCILGGALVLKFEPGELHVDAAGMVYIAAACMCWALDNNLTQRLSLRDPFAVVRIKATGAGIANTAIALGLLRASLPAPPTLAAALVLGSLSYGLSVVLDAYALRDVGAAREAAYFATAPFLGAVLSMVLLGESLGWADVAAMLAMALGVVLMLRERHSHRHIHEALEHEHLHEHDEHHQHEHAPGQAASGPHSHRHRHERLEHEHPHVSDLHHRHPH